MSVHVLNEFVAIARRKLGMSWPEILEALEAFRVLCQAPIPIAIDTHQAALEISERYSYHIYDSLVIAAAVKAQCNILYSEDMHDWSEDSGPANSQSVSGEILAV